MEALGIFRRDKPVVGADDGEHGRGDLRDGVRELAGLGDRLRVALPRVPEGLYARGGRADAVVAVPHARLLIAELLGQRLPERKEDRLQVDGRAFAEGLRARRGNPHTGNDEGGGIGGMTRGPAEDGGTAHRVARQDRALDTHGSQEGFELVGAVGFILVARGVLGVAVVNAVVGVDVEAIAEVRELLPPGLGAGAVAVKEDERGTIGAPSLGVVDVVSVDIDPGHAAPPAAVSAESTGQARGARCEV